jgi:hypothetical protein
VCGAMGATCDHDEEAYIARLPWESCTIIHTKASPIKGGGASKSAVHSL